MNLKLVVAGLAIVFASGCCSCRDRYAPWLTQIRENLAEDVRPKYAEALKASGRKPDLMANDLALVDDTVASIDKVIGGDEEVLNGTQ